MKEHPIIFSGDEVTAFLEGRKTQTRLVLTPQPLGYPSFYTVPVTLGVGLFAQEGKYRGGGLGHFHPPVLTLYGSHNFARLGGRAWQHPQHHEQWTCPYQVGDWLSVKEAAVRLMLEITEVRVEEEDKQFVWVLTVKQVKEDR